MQIKFRPSRKAQQLLLLHGVPSAVLHAFELSLTTSLVTSNITQRDGRNRAVTVAQQIAWFQQVLRDLPTDPAIWVFGSSEFYYQARQAALLVFSRYLQYSLNYPREFDHSTPRWYRPTAGFNCELLAAHERGEYRAANLLLLDGLHADMPISKLDKLHDILNVLGDRPCGLVIHNRDPYQYCVDRLGVRPSKLFLFARRAARRVI